jgi:hypothetical protein
LLLSLTPRFLLVHSDAEVFLKLGIPDKAKIQQDILVSRGDGKRILYSWHEKRFGLVHVGHFRCGIVVSLMDSVFLLLACMLSWGTVMELQLHLTSKLVIE